MIIGPPRRRPPADKPLFGSVELDLSHRLMRGAPAVFLFNEGGGPPTVLGTVGGTVTPHGSPTWATNRLGLARAYGAPTDYDASVGSIASPNTALTIAMIRRKTDTTLRSASHLCVNDPVGGRCQCHMPFSDGNVYWDFGGAGAPNRLIWSGYSVSTNPEYWTLVAGTNGSAIYFNGRQVASQSTPITATVGSNPVQWNQWTAGGSTGDVVEAIQGIVSPGVEWTARDVFAWWNEPYAFLRSKAPPRFYSFPAPAGGPTIIETVGTAAGTTATVGNASAIWRISASTSGLGTPSPAGSAIWDVAATTTATGTATGLASAIWRIGATTAGLGTPSANGSAIWDSAATSTAVSTASGLSSAIWRVNASSTSVGTLTIGASAIWDVTTTASGVSTGTGVGQDAATTGSDGAASGTAIVTGVSGATCRIAASTAGTSTVAGDGAKLPGVGSTGTGTASGTATVAAQSAIVRAGSGSAAGTGVVGGAAQAIVAVAGSALGVGTPLGVVGAVALSSGAILGVATVSANGMDIAIATSPPRFSASSPGRRNGAGAGPRTGPFVASPRARSFSEPPHLMTAGRT